MSGPAIWRDPALLRPAAILMVMLLLVIVGPWLAVQPYDSIDFDSDWGQPPSRAHPFGTDELGRDLFARTCVGGRLSLAVGLVSTLVSLLIGTLWGALAGWVGGRVDDLMMRIVDVLYALPFMFFVILLMVLFGRHWLLIFVAIGAVSWLDMARIVRAQTRALRSQPFVDAAVISGLSGGAILLRHIAPNLAAVVLVGATLTIPQAILVESFLSFLGLGIQEPATSWGALVNDGARTMESTPWALAFPAGLLVLTLLAFNQLGDALRARLDGPRG